MSKKTKSKKGYKGFDKDLKCRGFQYSVDGIYEQEEAPVICLKGFHYCEYPLDVLGYYPPIENNRYCVIEDLGVSDKEEYSMDTKVATNKIKIDAEIGLHGLIDATIKFVYDHVKKDNKKSAHKEEGYSHASNTGDSSVASNTGYSSVASNTGDSSVASNTGDSSVASNTGYRSVASNTGYRSVASNTGDSSVASNTGDSSVASNTGYRSVASNTGESGIASSLGIFGRAKGGKGTWLVLAEWEEKDYNYVVKEVKTTIVDGKKIKENTLYQLKGGKFVEVDDE